jgi:hypothetical protein
LCCHHDCQVYLPNLCGLDLTEKTLSSLPKSRKGSEAALNKVTTAVIAPDVPSKSQQTRPTDIAVTFNPPLPSTHRRPTLDDFHFIAVLGKGNFGKVMLAEEKEKRQLYAIKVLKKEFILQNDEIESTRSEKRVFVTINRQRHPFLVGLHSCFQTETRIYFVMVIVTMINTMADKG